MAANKTMPTPADARAVLLAKLGRHKMGKGCLYVRRLADVDQAVLEELVRESIATTEALYGANATPV